MPSHPLPPPLAVDEVEALVVPHVVAAAAVAADDCLLAVAWQAPTAARPDHRSPQRLPTLPPDAPVLLAFVTEWPESCPGLLAKDCSPERQR